MTPTTCTRCPTILADPSFSLCPACALVADAEDYDVPDKPVFAGVWTRICATIGGMWS